MAQRSGRTANPGLLKWIIGIVKTFYKEIFNYEMSSDSSFQKIFTFSSTSLLLTAIGELLLRSEERDHY